MSKPPLVTLQGQLTMALLFEGSKSEGLYPVLVCAEGRQYRVHVRKTPVRQLAKPLIPLLDQHVVLTGVADDLRGHWRLVLEPDFSAQLLAQQPPAEPLGDTELAP
jgi:hypothetical protein